MESENLGTDLIVTFEGGDKYLGRFCTLEELCSRLNLDHVMPVDGRHEYYKILDIIVVRDFVQDNLEKVIEAMLNEGDFQLVFKKL